ncbi:hypothetical protein BDK51DRAFT_42788 [Blyttiomyces helicus]|uniref:Uncharacterized protein n=1 Tax=Blyttiomyces helicus TaxID=388810 RepID=A0A4P9WGP7_9FUNG|nr:hypothetical protein BDK51DRAFT_42788 [Blyttiomyces helicus]|eukprot:RKO91981.1 hypothetical protein BDK51DRAFT_42788 [Blyttiomyces helicus]
MAASIGKRVGWADFSKTVGIGLFMGLVTAGSGARVGQWGVPRSRGVTVPREVRNREAMPRDIAHSGGIRSTYSAAFSMHATALDNHDHGRPWNEGLTKAVIVGAVSGAATGIIG